MRAHLSGVKVRIARAVPGRSAVPLVAITLAKGKPSAYVRAIADGVHEALVESFRVPPDDRFQVIRQVGRDELIYDPGYLGVRRTDDVVFIHITASRWRDTAMKRELYRNIAHKLARSPGLRREDVIIVLAPNDKDDWSFGLGEASYVQENAA